MKKLNFLVGLMFSIFVSNSCNEVSFHPFYFIVYNDTLNNKIDTFLVNTMDTFVNAEKNYFSLIPFNYNSDKNSNFITDTFKNIQIITLHKIGDNIDSLQEITHMFNVSYYFDEQIYFFKSINEFFSFFSYKPPVGKLNFLLKDLNNNFNKPEIIELLLIVELSDGRFFYIKNKPIKL